MDGADTVNGHALLPLTESQLNSAWFWFEENVKLPELTRFTNYGQIWLTKEEDGPVFSIIPCRIVSAEGPVTALRLTVSQTTDHDSTLQITAFARDDKTLRIEATLGRNEDVDDPLEYKDIAPVSAALAINHMVLHHSPRMQRVDIKTYLDYKAVAKAQLC
ncbi:MAG: hypothetical protein AB7G06_09470 [Bdellovibrionales bacterium]